MKRYVDGFVLVVEKKNVAAYKKIAGKAGKIWKKHGALNYVECLGDDLHPDTGGVPTLPFPKLTKVKEDETIIFAFIIYQSKAHRNKVNAAVMKDANMQEDYKDMPFDFKRLSFGGFTTLVDL